MTKVVLSDVGDIRLPSAATTINNNNDALVAAVQNTLSLDGTAPNQMQSDLDLNSNDILNGGNAQFSTETVGTLNATDVKASTIEVSTSVSVAGALLTQLTGPAGPTGPAGQGIAVGGTTGQFLKKNSNTDYDTGWATVSGSGTVTSVSVVTANGFAGTVATGTTTPAITLTTGISGVLKGNGTAISAASAGTDYQAPITLTTTGTSGAATLVSNTLNIPQYTGGGGGDASTNTATSVDSEIALFSSTTGKLLKRATGTGIAKITSGVLGTATSGTDYEVPITFSTGLTRSTNTVTVNSSQSISTLSNLTSNGSVETTGGTGALSVVANTGTGSNVHGTHPVLSIQDGDLTLQNTADNTKQVIFSLASIGTGTTSTWTFPAGTGTFVSTGATQTLTNKTLTSPTMTTPVLGTPTSGTLTNCTGYTLANLASIASGMATFLTTPSSANLAATVTDETGSGSLVFGTSPTLTTAVLGSSTATTQAALDASTKVATTAYVDAASSVSTINAQSGTTYTFVLADAGKTVSGSNAASTTFTIPLNATVAYPVGTVINLIQVGAGQITIAITATGTLNSKTSLVKLAAQYSAAAIQKTATDTWVLFGDLA